MYHDLSLWQLTPSCLMAPHIHCSLLLYNQMCDRWLQSFPRSSLFLSIGLVPFLSLFSCYFSVWGSTQSTCRVPKWYCLNVLYVWFYVQDNNENACQIMHMMGSSHIYTDWYPVLAHSTSLTSPATELHHPCSCLGYVLLYHHFPPQPLAWRTPIYQSINIHTSPLDPTPLTAFEPSDLPSSIDPHLLEEAAALCDSAPFFTCSFSPACPTCMLGDMIHMHSVLNSFFQTLVSGKENETHTGVHFWFVSLHFSSLLMTTPFLHIVWTYFKN